MKDYTGYPITIEAALPYKRREMAMELVSMIATLRRRIEKILPGNPEALDRPGDKRELARYRAVSALDVTPLEKAFLYRFVPNIEPLILSTSGMVELQGLSAHLVIRLRKDLDRAGLLELTDTSPTQRGYRLKLSICPKTGEGHWPMQIKHSGSKND